MNLNLDSIIGVVGAGAMGAGIAQVAAQAGHTVVVVDEDEAALARGRCVVETGAARVVKRGKLAEADARALIARVRWTLDPKDLAPAGLVVEAIVENPDIKRDLFKKLEAILVGDAVIATNTSSLSVTALASALAQPQRFLGLHFFNPAPVMKLVEVVSGAATDRSVAHAAADLMRSWGKEAVEARDVPGFIVNRVARPFYGEGWRALDEGAADAATIDFLFRELAGFRMGPFELGDFIGHDINDTAARFVYGAYFGRTRFAPSVAQGRLVAAGRLGRKSGAGVYDYGKDAEAPAPQFAKSAQRPAESIGVGLMRNALADMLGAAGARVKTDTGVPSEFITVDGVLVGSCRGWTAAAFAQLFARSVVMLDWTRDIGAATVIAFSASDQKAQQAGLALALACGKKAIELPDRPGLVVLRTLLQLANAAADAVRDRVADAASIDHAMRFGANYPFGPLAWAQEFGFARVVEALDAIAAETGDNMYSAGEFLRAAARR